MGFALLVGIIDGYAAWYAYQHHYAPLLVVWLIFTASLALVGFLSTWLVSLRKSAR